MSGRCCRRPLGIIEYCKATTKLNLDVFTRLSGLRSSLGPQIWPFSFGSPCFFSSSNNNECACLSSLSETFVMFIVARWNVTICRMYREQPPQTRCTLIGESTTIRFTQCLPRVDIMICIHIFFQSDAFKNDLSHKSWQSNMECFSTYTK